MSMQTLSGRRIAVPETRELDLFAAMLERRGAAVLRCPLVAIKDAPDPAPVLEWIRRFAAGGCDDLVLLTGEGLRRLLGCIERHEPDLREAFLRELARVHKGLFALTTNQNLTIAGVEERDRPAIEALLREYGLENDARASAMRQHSIACVALPTCGLAMAESERYLPTLIDRIEEILVEAGLEREPITIRMSGCPNGCARPYVAEIALVGKAPGKYNLYLGAAFNGERLNALYRENIGEQQILDALRPVLLAYAKERKPGERFGDFVIRTGVVREMRAGRDFQREQA